ncbi:MAG: hypothetical protein JO210_11960, partial [Acidobacteriaceae bacterium]|nr:hypothetical protein [Acidobacteriaceae bacterium]
MRQTSIALYTAVLLASLPIPCKAGALTILASCRSGWVEVADPNTLEPLGRIMAGRRLEGVAASPDGKMLFVTGSIPSDPNGCCALYGIDLIKREAEFLLEPAFYPIVTPTGESVLTQRGDDGVFIFDAKTLVQRPKIELANFHARQVSPDGRRLFGITSAQGSWLDIYDLQEHQLAQHLQLPIENISGVWLGGILYVYGFDGRNGRLWKIAPETSKLDAGVNVYVPSFATSSSDYLRFELTGSNGHLFLHEEFGMKLDRRSESAP